QTWDGTVTISHSTLSDNHAGQASGGAVSNIYGTVKVSESTFVGNSGVGGGAVDNHQGTLTVIDCTLSGNVAAGGAGGAILSSGRLTVTHSTFLDNVATVLLVGT